MKLKKRVYFFVLLIITGTFIFFLQKSNIKDIKKNNKVKTNIKLKINEVNLNIVGDLLFEQPYYNALKNGEDENKYFSMIKEYFDKADINIGNMEVVIGNDYLKMSGTGYEFCAPESTGKKVIDLGFDVLSTANNHSYDRGIDGINSTIDFFKKNSSILTVGTNKTSDKENKILNINNIKFGFLSYASGTNKKVDTNDLYAINLYRDQSNNKITDEIKKKISREIADLRRQVDVIIIILHWGAEFTYDPTIEQREFASFLNSLGVDIIIGSHSHCMQPIEWIESADKRTLVYYSMGNFVSADEDISRTGETFDNAYQVGLLSNIKIIKDKDKIIIDKIKTEPIINYYDETFQNFLLVPYSKYTNDLEQTHLRFRYNFNKQFISNMYNSVIDQKFREN